MRPKQRNRLVLAIVIVMFVAISAALALTALEENINLFYSPTMIANGEAPQGRLFRAGGMVSEGSVQRDPESLEVSFRLNDEANEILVKYTGILPDLFREGQGIVVQGKLGPDGSVMATEVLAKHDENYMPPEVEHALKTAKEAAAANAEKE